MSSEQPVRPAALHVTPPCMLRLTQTCARPSQLTPRLFHAFHPGKSLVIHTADSNVLDAVKLMYVDSRQCHKS